MMLAPAAAQASATARPIPRPAPVTAMTFPSRRPTGGSVPVDPSDSVPAAEMVMETGAPRTPLYCERMASVRQFQVTFDCAEPERVARFWCEALGYVVPPPPEGFDSWAEFDGSLPPERQGAAFACVDPAG